jgi:hypothetical protein
MRLHQEISQKGYGADSHLTSAVVCSTGPAVWGAAWLEQGLTCQWWVFAQLVNKLPAIIFFALNGAQCSICFQSKREHTVYV